MKRQRHTDAAIRARSLRLIAGLLVLLTAHAASADRRYSLNSYPEQQDGGTLSGFIIVTDDAIDDGLLSASEIVEWEFTAIDATMANSMTINSATTPNPRIISSGVVQITPGHIVIPRPAPPVGSNVLDLREQATVDDGRVRWSRIVDLGIPSDVYIADDSQGTPASGDDVIYWRTGAEEFELGGVDWKIATFAPGIDTYNIVDGTNTGFFNPVLSGGVYEGLRFSELPEGAIVGFRDLEATEIVTHSSSGLSTYDIVTGSLGATTDPLLTGGFFFGLRFSQLPAFVFVGVRDGSGAEVATQGPTGIHYYGIDTGASAGSFNPTLSGGDFDGKTFAQLPSEAYVGFRDLGGSQIAALGPSGVNYYDIVDGSYLRSFDPTLSGGDFDGLRFSEIPADRFAGFRDAGGSQIALVPEPLPLACGAAALLAMLALARLRRRGG